MGIKGEELIQKPVVEMEEEIDNMEGTESEY